MMIKKGVDEQLRKRIEEIYRETKNIVKIRKKKIETFWIRQGSDRAAH